MPASRRAISPDSPRKKIKDTRRLQLIDANMESIARHGLTETTISHVSEAAGMSRGIINFYFKSKEEMMRETLTHLMQEQAAAWRDAIEKKDPKSSTPRARLEAGVRAMFGARLFTRKKLTVWAVFVAHAATHPAYRFIFESETGKMRDDIAAFASLSDVGVDALGFANGLINYIRGLRLEMLIGDTGRSRQDLEQEALAFLFHLDPPREKDNVVPMTKQSGKKTKVIATESETMAISDLFAVG